MKKATVIIIILVLVALTSCSFGKDTPTATANIIPTTDDISAYEKAYTKAIHEYLNDSLSLEYLKIEYEKRIQQLDSNNNAEIIELNEKISKLQLRLIDILVEYQQLIQEHINIQRYYAQTDSLIKDLSDNLTNLKAILVIINNGGGLDSANMTPTEKISFITLFKKWYSNSLPDWAKH